MVILTQHNQVKQYHGIVDGSSTLARRRNF